MALNLYEYDEDNNQYLQISEDGLHTNPIKTSHNGTNGETVEKKVYLKNEDANFYYTDIIVTSIPARKVKVGDINYPEAFISYKIINQDSQPTENQWLSIRSGNEVEMEDIGDASAGDTSYKPIWIQVGIPTGTRVQTIRDVSISLQAKSNPVGV